LKYAFIVTLVIFGLLDVVSAQESPGETVGTSAGNAEAVAAGAPVAGPDVQSPAKKEVTKRVTKDGRELLPWEVLPEELPDVSDTGHYVSRVSYDKGPSSVKIDTVLHKKVRSSLLGYWRTNVVPHGHAFRDATIDFCPNDTLFSTTFTWADSNRYQKTGEYKFNAQYKILSDSTLRSREVFLDKNVVRWDYYTFRVKGDKLFYHLYKLEFRDLNDNWLDAKQSFDNVPPEVFIRLKDTPRCGDQSKK